MAKDVPEYTIHIGSHEIFEKKRFDKEDIKKHETILGINSYEEIHK